MVKPPCPPLLLSPSIKFLVWEVDSIAELSLVELLLVCHRLLVFQCLTSIGQYWVWCLGSWQIFLRVHNLFSGFGAPYGAVPQRAFFSKLQSRGTLCLLFTARFLMEVGTRFLRHERFVFHSLPAENKSHLSISSKLCLCIFYLASVGRESRDFGQQ